MSEMKIVMKKVEDLIPYENNPRRNDNAVEYVENSIKEFGFKVPIIIDKENVIVAGHTRLKAAENLGIKEVPCIVASDLNEEQIKAFRLADNKVAEKSVWDFDLLDKELEEIMNIDMSAFDFEVTGIDWDSIEDLTDKNYKEPESNRLRCPLCNGVDYAIHFKKVKNTDEEESE